MVPYPVLVLVLLLGTLQQCEGQLLVNFTGTPQFKSVRLQWAELPGDGSRWRGRGGAADTVTVRFCENQIWGEHYCRSSVRQTLIRAD